MFCNYELRDIYFKRVYAYHRNVSNNSHAAERMRHELKKMLPFLGAEEIDMIAKNVLAGKRKMNLDCMYPFMSDEDLKRVFYYYLDKEE